ncbi:MAG: hypothetical protein ABIK28_11890 [Planctomycetota bacterium]
MAILSVGLVSVLAYRALQKTDAHPTPVVLDTANLTTEQYVENRSGKSEEELSSRFPLFLRASLPFKKIGVNPFRAFYLDEEEAKIEPEKALKEKSGEELAREEKSTLSTFKVTCTVTGRNAFAVVDGKILKPGQEYRGFVIKEIGEGYALFSGQMTDQKIHVQF